LVDVNLIPRTNTLLYHYANTINYKNIFTIAAHGYKGVLIIPYNRNITLWDLAQKAKESGKESILLIACDQRKDIGEGDLSNDAQKLADYSGLPVIFSHKYVRIIPYYSPFSFDFPWRNPWDIAYPRRNYVKKNY